MPQDEEHERDDRETFENSRVPARLVVGDEDDEVHGDRLEERHQLRPDALDLVIDSKETKPRTHQIHHQNSGKIEQFCRTELDSENVESSFR